VIATNVPSAADSSQTNLSRDLEDLHRASTNEAAAALAAALPASSGPAMPRIVTREGFVRRAHNLQAPTDFELRALQNSTLVDFLQPRKGQNFKIFVGTHITVTGLEVMDPRWPRTPVLQVQSVDLTP
jgi:hypothetical protein